MTILSRFQLTQTQSESGVRPSKINKLPVFRETSVALRVCTFN